MKRILFSEFPPELNTERICTRWQVRKESSFYDEIEETREFAAGIMKPKAVVVEIGEFAIDERGVNIGGVRLESAKLSEIIGKAKKAYLYAATGGAKPEDPDGIVFDSLWSMYLGDAIFTAIDKARSYVEEETSCEEVFFANPGDVEDWALGENAKLFELIGSVPEEVGITVGRGGLLRPLDSVCGIFYVTKE